MKKKRILVFPCGSEIGLEVYRSLKFSIHIEMIGASSVDDHGKFVFENYIGGLPLIDDPACIPVLKKIIQEKNIDAIYPTMDKVIFALKRTEKELGCLVVGSSDETNTVCLSKSDTYHRLSGTLPTPRLYSNTAEIKQYPVFAKPDQGYGSRGAKKINNLQDLENHKEQFPGCIIMEYLPGEEFTVDCFTDRHGRLMFIGPRQRKRISNGISVNSFTMLQKDPIISGLAEKINQQVRFRGAWFFQLKKNAEGKYVLLEIASRFGGTSSVHRMQGVNFALLSVFDAFDEEVSIHPESFHVEVDRALDSRFKIGLDFDTVYIDLDDTILVNGIVDPSVMAMLYAMIGKDKKIILITRHRYNLEETLNKHRIKQVFDEIIHLNDTQNKADFILNSRSIFIDDSYAERKKVREGCGIPVFAPDAIECLY